MTRYIPIRCFEIEAAPGKPHRGVRTQISFIVPQFSSEIIAEFIPSQTKAAIKRAMQLIDIAIGGATKAELTEPLDKYLKPAKKSRSERLTDEELAEFKADNGWIELDDIMEDETVVISMKELAEIICAPTGAPAACHNGESLEEYWDRTIGPRGTTVTSDGRYIVDPVNRSISPVEDMPGDIVAVMPVWEVKDREISFWPRSFDIPAGMEETFKYEEIAARLLLTEIAVTMWGVSEDDLMFTSEGEYSIGLIPSCQLA